MNLLANILTILSLVCGFVSLIFSLENHFTLASWAIILSVILDGLDGQVARKNPIPSEFGKELDSLVDVVCFGIAPAILGYIFIYRHFHPWATLALFFYLFCSVIRLAKYNVAPNGTLHNCFSGLPTTVSGGILVGFVLIFRKGDNLNPLPQFVPFIFLALVIALGLLMVSRVRYLNLDGVKKVLGINLKVAGIILAVLAIFAIVYQKAGVITFSILSIYLLFSPFVVKQLNE